MLCKVTLLQGITPACAGSSYGEQYRGGGDRDHPRAGGDAAAHFA